MSCTRGTFYQCQTEHCKMIMTVVNPCDCCSDCEIVCCGEPVNEMEAKTADKATEKHVPVIEAIEGGYRVVVGSTLHPMTEEHYIEWIELRSEQMSYRRYLKPGMQPEAIFLVPDQAVCAFEHCNVHGLWNGQ